MYINVWVFDFTYFSIIRTPLPHISLDNQRSTVTDKDFAFVDLNQPPRSSCQLDLKELNSVMRYEAAGVATRWYDLGVELFDSNTAVLGVIKTSHQRDDDRCSDMFKTWLEMKPDASWNRLVEALFRIGLNKAAENVKHSKIVQQGIS